jgi:saccharopine dehydrogenase-like NADP-dependent oxidoreductase
MKTVVLGTGMIGAMMARELAKCAAITSVLAVDASADSVERCVAEAPADVPADKLKGLAADLGAPGVLKQLLADADLAVGALPHSLSMATTHAAIAARCHLIDLVGSAFREKAALDEQARRAGILIVPGLGVAPGLANVLCARGVELLDETDKAEILCGGIPRHPLPPLWYQIVFRLESVFGLFTRPASAVVNGEFVTLPPLSGLEACRFPEPVGECEAVITDAHSVAFTLAGRIKTLYEKTVRYRGHWQKMQTLAELGYFAEAPVDVGGQLISPRRFSMALLGPQMKGASNEDVTVLRVTVTGTRDRRPVRHEWEMVDLYDQQRSMPSMTKTTGFPVVIFARWLAEGSVPERGVLAPEQLLATHRFDAFLAALATYGVEVSKSPASAP